MRNEMRILLYCGLGLLILGFLYLLLMTFFFGYKLTPTDMISVGMAFVGIVIGWPPFEESLKKTG
jgi:EamA domain-containing membrane protein RarD